MFARSPLLLSVLAPVLALTVDLRAGDPRFEFRLHEIGEAGNKLGQTSLVDVDRDGDLDFITGARNGDVQWWEHRAADRWILHRIGTRSPTDVGGVAFDVDGDGWIDQVSGSAWWRNPGEPWRGEFERHSSGAISSHDSRAADIDGDGRLDLVSMRDRDGLFWYRVPEDPRQPWPSHRVGAARHSGLAVGDVDGDDDVDLVVANAWHENLEGDGTRWARHENIPFEGRRYNEQGMATQNRLADLDGDGDLDLAITDGETDGARLSWIENLDGKGREWREHELARDRGALHSLAIADFDGDGALDIFTCEMAIGGSGRWWIHAGNGQGEFQGFQVLEGVAGHETVAGDVDLDGDVDLCSKPWNGGRHVYLENRRIIRDEPRRPRLLVLTDIGGDPDDLQSLVRLLVTSNEFEIEGFIASASGTPGELGKDIVQPGIIRQAIEAYSRVRPSLVLHSPDFPAAPDLLARVHEGNPHRGVANLGKGHDTAGSRRIIEIVEAPDPRPVHVAIWGGSTDLAQALWRVRTDRSPAELRAFISKIRVHAIGHQDDTGPWILREFPALWYTLSLSPDGNKHVSVYRGLWKHGDRTLTSRSWIDRHVRQGHGPLGALYPPKTWSPPEGALKEGDTPSFFAFLANGPGDPSRPDQGGWGGRFRFQKGAFRDARDTVGDEISGMATVWRWRPAFQSNFAARMDWCVKSFEEANHGPRVSLNGDDTPRPVVIELRPPDKIRLEASASDPDGDVVRFRWWVYPEAGTITKPPALSRPEGATLDYEIPAGTGPGTIHLILEARDDGEPPWTSYRRAVIRLLDR